MNNLNDKTAANLDLDQILGAFTELEDPRKSNATRHLFSELLFISLSAIICGAEGFHCNGTFCSCKERLAGAVA